MILAVFALSCTGVAAEEASEWRGMHSRERRLTVMVARDAGQWTNMWSVLETPPPRPLAEGEAAIAVFLGPRRTGGYSLEFLHVRSEGCVTLAEVREHAPEPGGFVTQAFSSPWVIRTLPAPPGSLVALINGQRVPSIDLAEASRCR